MKLCLDCDHEFQSASWACPSCGRVPPVVDGVVDFAGEFDDLLGGFDPARSQALAAVEEWYFWFKARAELILWVVDRFFPAPGRILEIGCGTGYVLSRLAGRYPAAQLAAGDIFIDGLRFVRQRVPSVSAMRVNAKRLPFAGEFDVIGAFDVLEHIDDDLAALRSIRRAVRPGGGAVLTVPQHPALWGPSDDFAHHVRRYRRGELEEKVEAAGFRVAFSTSFVGLLLPLLLAARLGKDGPYDPDREFSISPVVNQVLAAVMTAERNLIRAGARLPAGGSRIVAAIAD